MIPNSSESEKKTRDFKTMIVCIKSRSKQSSCRVSDRVFQSLLRRQEVELKSHSVKILGELDYLSKIIKLTDLQYFLLYGKK